MNIKILKPSDCNHTTRSIKNATLNISKIGVFSFNRKAVEELHLAEGLCVVFAQDADRPQDWYIAHDDDGFKLRKKVNDQLCFSSKGLQIKIVKTLKEKPAKPGISFMISTQPQQYNGRGMFAIITSKLL